MASLGRHDVGQAFRNNTQLQQFMLTDVTPTGRILGTGSYGSVQEVLYKHLTCAAKKLHETLVEAGNDGVPQVVHKYLQECQLMASLRHPNITQFLGLCLLPDTRLPLLVMEQLETSLDDLLEHMPGLPLSLKRSVLEDVASGLVYLHDRQPPVIHRDLTAKNVLLTSSLLAKITDMGNSRIVSMRPGQMARTLSQLPGTLVYMPPEALDDTSRYGPSLDVFSFGHLTLYTITQMFPGNLLSSTFLNPDNPHDVRARTEVERRREYIELLETQIGWLHPGLVTLVKECLHNGPDHRPATEEVLTRLQRMRVEVEGEYGGSLVKLDIDKVLLAKEMKRKDKRIEELTQQLRELGDRPREEHMRSREFPGDLEELQTQVQEKDLLIASKERDIAAKDDEIQRLQREMEAKDGLVQREREAKQVMESELREELQRKERELSGLREELRRSQEQQVTGQMPLPLKFQWRRGPDMPYSLTKCSIQSVLVKKTVYFFERGDSFVTYHTRSGKWDRMYLDYETDEFTMTAINNQLVLVGGVKNYRVSKMLGVWSDYSKEWTHPYPEMPTAREKCSAVGYNEWLVVAGGMNDERELLSSVEVLNTDSNQWFSGPPTPVPWCNMKTAVVGDRCYFMGGDATKYRRLVSTNVVYSVSLPELISRLPSTIGSTRIWKGTTELDIHSTPLSVDGYLLALGGKKDSDPVTDIHVYQPDNDEWVKVGDLPSPRYRCTGVMINNRELLLVGGVTMYRDNEERMDIAVLS